jgi:hypothetical protein
MYAIKDKTMADPHNIRKSGKTTSEEVTKEECTEEKLTEPLGDATMEDDSPRLKRPYFQRLRTDWTSDQKIMLQRIHNKVEKEIQSVFSDAFSIMFELYDVVRVRDENAEDDEIWQKNESGSYVEDWSKLNHRQRERFLFLITSRLFTWEQQASSLNFEALFAKAEWEQSFATGYESLPGTRPTIEDRTSRARLKSQDDYYFALMRTYFSRRADAVVRSMQGISQRIKDMHTV